jgi:hypothetical protein
MIISQARFDQCPRRPRDEAAREDALEDTEVRRCWSRGSSADASEAKCWRTIFDSLFGLVVVLVIGPNPNHIPKSHYI